MIDLIQSRKPGYFCKKLDFRILESNYLRSGLLFVSLSQFYAVCFYPLSILVGFT